MNLKNGSGNGGRDTIIPTKLNLQNLVLGGSTGASDIIDDGLMLQNLKARGGGASTSDMIPMLIMLV